MFAKEDATMMIGMVKRERQNKDSDGIPHNDDAIRRWGQTIFAGIQRTFSGYALVAWQFSQ
jgi:hypothetical protein